MNKIIIPYGVPDSAVDGFGFTGEMTDANGLVYLRARYYDPNVGVFASLDPFEGVHNRPMSVNGYSWVEGNVVNATDPSGMFCFVPVIGWLGCGGSALLYGAGALGLLNAAYHNPCTAPNYRHEDCQTLIRGVQDDLQNLSRAVRRIIDGACDVAERVIDIFPTSSNPAMPIPTDVPQSQPAPTPRAGRQVNRNPLERTVPWIVRFAIDRVVERANERERRNNEDDCDIRVLSGETVFDVVYGSPLGERISAVYAQQTEEMATVMHGERNTLSKTTVEEYAKSMCRGGIPSAIHLVKLRHAYMIQDGNHRFVASRLVTKRNPNLTMQIRSILGKVVIEEISSIGPNDGHGLYFWDWSDVRWV